MKKIRYIIGLCAILWSWSVRSQVNDKIVCDTLRWHFEAVAGDTVSFTFSGDVGATFVVDWGDGDTSSYIGNGYGDRDASSSIEAWHVYDMSQSYEVALYGYETIGEAFPEQQCYVENVFGLGMPMVYVQGGTFLMGGTNEQGNPESDELPVHSVTLESFYIGVYEVTRAQWMAVMEMEPSFNNLPVVCSWVSAVAFCEKLSEMTGKKYRLPTEAEWEYAARGGQHRDGTRYAGSNSYYEVAWTGPLRREPRPVGQKKPNGLGLYDMSGNVQEWCSDWYGENYYSYSPSVNPQGPSSGSDRVVRGGSVDYYQNMFRCRVALRDHESPAMYAVTAYSVGFRVVCEP